MASTDILGFGKHREKTLEEAAAIDELVVWTLGIGNPKGKLAIFAEYLRANRPEAVAAATEKEEVKAAAAAAAPAAVPTTTAAATDILGFGKHREKTLEEAAAIDELVDWTLGIGNPKGKLAVFAEYLRAHHPAAAADAAAKGADKAAAAAAAKAAPAAAAAKRSPSTEATSQAESSDDETPLNKRPRRERADEHEADASRGADEMAMSKRMAERVIALGERGDAEGVLSVLGVPITRETPVDEQRKAFRALARLLHPDKLGRYFAGATKAFQMLTSAFESLSAPEPPAAPGKGKASGPSVGRSNEGCYRTKVGCPRCYSQWGGPSSGLQPYEYTFMMQGLRTYKCCGCLLEFGCMTAIHTCPHCEEEVPYQPKDFHTHKNCMHCTRTYGFKLYTTGPRIDATLREELLAKAATRQKKKDSDSSRAQRRPLELPAAQKRAQQELLFKFCLIDECPRCGHVPKSKAEGPAEELAREEHLRECTDAKAHRRHAAKLAQQAAVREASSIGAKKQDDVERRAAWQFCGGGAATAWLLTDAQLEKAVAEKGLATEGGRTKQLMALAHSERTAGAPSGDTPGAVPAALHSLSTSALADVCAAHGLSVPADSGKDEIVEMLEAHQGLVLPALANKPAEEEDDDEEAELAEGEEEEGDDDDDI